MNETNEAMCLNRDCLNSLYCYCQNHPDNITPSTRASDIQKCKKFVGIQD